MSEIKSLKLHSLKHCLENLELDEIQYLFDEINDNNILDAIKKSLDNKLAIVETEAPNTFRIPISFVRFTAASAARPAASKPRRQCGQRGSARG